MKKIFLILSVALASFANADYAELRELVALKQHVENVSVLREQSKQIELQKDVSFFAHFALEKMFVRNPKIFNSEFECFPHTFIWYKWKEYDKASNIGKLEILKEIETLTKE